MNAVARFIKGFRTMISAGAFAVVGLLSVAGSLDLTPVVAMFVKDPAKLGAAMVGVGALFAFLRYISSTPVGMKDSPAVDEAPDDGKNARQKIDAGA